MVFAIIAAPASNGYAVGGWQGVLLNQHGFGGNCHPDGVCLGGCARDAAGGRHGYGVAPIVGVGVAVGIEDFDGAVYAT